MHPKASLSNMYGKQYVLAMFFFFHVLAIGIASIPQEANDSFSSWLRQTWQPITHPYIQLTWQWQRWNLFAPDPLVEESQYRLQAFRDDAWEDIALYSPDTLPWWRRAYFLKVLRSALEGERRYLHSLLVLQSLCVKEDIKPLEHVRLLVRTTGITNITLPRHTTFEHICSLAT